MTPLAHGSLLRAAETAPRVDIDALAAGGVLVLVPHPDDETLGCGAAIAAAIAGGHAVHVVAVTSGDGSHPRSRRWPPARMARRRREELGAALEVLGGGHVSHEWLGYPDQGAPSVARAREEGLIERLLDTLRRRGLANLWTTWGGDPHPDHVACDALGDALVGAARGTGLALAEARFAVWGRFVEADERPGGEALARFEAGAARRALKRRALACHATQMSALVDDDPDGFRMPEAMQRHFVEHDELFVRRPVPNRPEGDRAREFDALYTDTIDPWRFRTSAYERGKYAATLAALPRARYRRAIEAGCSIGELTGLLGGRADAVLGLDVSGVAVAEARRVHGATAGLVFEVCELPGEWPVGTADLVVLSELLYFLEPDEIDTLAERVAETLEPGGHCVVVCWLGENDRTLDGDGAAGRFARAFGDVGTVVAARREPRYRIEVFERRAITSSPGPARARRRPSIGLRP